MIRKNTHERCENVMMVLSQHLHFFQLKQTKQKLAANSNRKKNKSMKRFIFFAFKNPKVKMFSDHRAR